MRKFTFLTNFLKLKLGWEEENIAKSYTREKSTLNEKQNYHIYGMNVKIV